MESKVFLGRLGGLKMKEKQNQLRPTSCLTSSVVGAQRLRSGKEVYCDDGWTVFQRRFNGNLDFDREWQDYKIGFGNLDEEFWWGLDKIHLLTHLKSCKLRVDLKSFNDEEAFAEYSVFAVENEANNYRLHVKSYNNASTAGNGLEDMKPLDGMQFTTRDRDNDRSTTNRNCAAHFEGGWWFNNCFYAFLNAPWGVSQKPEKNIIWGSWKGYNESLKATKMKLRCD